MLLKLNLQRFAPPPLTYSIKITVNGIENQITMGDYLSWGDNYSNLKDWFTLPYSISDNKVVWNDGTILQYNGVDVLPTDDIINNGQYTTRSNTPTGGTNKLKFGTETPSKLYMGKTEVTKAYLGDTLVYEK